VRLICLNKDYLVKLTLIWAHASLPTNAILIDSAVFAGLTHVTNTCIGITLI